MSGLEMARQIDAVIIVGYLLVSFACGLLARWLFAGKSISDDDYYLAGRRVPSWVNGVSQAVTAMNADVAPAYCGLAVVVGLPVAWFYLSRFGLALLIAALLFAARWRQLAVRTGPEFYSLRFDGRAGTVMRIYTSLFGVFVLMMPWIGAGLLGVHKIFGPIFGIEDKAVTLMIVLPLMLAYVWIAGFAGVLATDVIQSAIILMANVILLGLVWSEFGGPTGLATAIEIALPEQHAEVLSLTPVAGHRVFGPLLVMAWLVVPTIGYGGNVNLDGQRVLSCPTPRAAARVGVWAQCSLFAMLLLLTLPALGALALHPELYAASAEVRETSYGILLDHFLPTGLLGIALAALLASVMSTIDSHLNYGAQTLVNDVYRPLCGEPSPRAAVWTGRLAMLGIVAGAVVVTYQAKSLIGIAVVLTGMFGATASLAWGQWWWWRVNFWSWLTAMVGGPLVYLLLGWLLPATSWWSALAGSDPAGSETVRMIQAVIGMAVTTVGWILVTLMTRPERMKTLQAFYLRAQPPGAWGPVRESLAAQADQRLPVAPRGLIAGGLGVAVVGGAAVALAVIGISAAAVGRYSDAALLWIVAGVLGWCFRSGFGWHLGRLGYGADERSSFDRS